MIIEAIINVIVTILLGVINLFPKIPEIKTDGLDSVFQFLTLTNTFINLSAFVSCVVVVFVFMNIRLVWSAVMWVVRKIPNIQ